MVVTKGLTTKVLGIVVVWSWCFPPASVVEGFAGGSPNDHHVAGKGANCCFVCHNFKVLCAGQPAWLPREDHLGELLDFLSKPGAGLSGVFCARF